MTKYNAKRTEAGRVKEADIQRLILDWLTANKIWHMRLNTGAMAGVHKGKKWFVRFGKPGMADILAMPPDLGICYVDTVSAFENGVDVTKEAQARDKKRRRVPMPLWIEVKAAKGLQSPAQKEFQQEVEQAGMVYVVARSLEDVTKVLWPL